MNFSQLRSFFVHFLSVVCSLLSVESYGQSQVIPCIMGKMNRLHGFTTNSFPPHFDKTELDVEDSISYTIPVIFHVIYLKANVGPALLKPSAYEEEIGIMNQCYGKYGIGSNTNAVGSKAGITFCLATKDPSGNPSTGIEYIQSSYSNLTETGEMLTKNLSRWDQTRYLNIWVVTNIDGSDNILGYSYLPRYSIKDKNHPNEVDGLVINYRTIGANNPNAIYGYSQGKTSVHEVGHYLDLMHPWGGDDKNAGEGTCSDDDGVDDTPPCEFIFYSQFPKCDHPQQCNSVRQIENYMDYSMDKCANLFTNGQVRNMRRALRKYRPNIISCTNLESAGCVASCAREKTDISPVIEFNPNPSSGVGAIFVSVEFKQGIHFHIVDMTGRIVKEFVLENVIAGRIPYDFSDLANGVYTIFAEAYDKTHVSRLIIQKR